MEGEAYVHLVLPPPLPHVQVQERDDSASGVQAVITSNKKRKKAHPVQVQERDPDDVREETEVIR